MKNLKIYLFASGVLLWGLGACTSSNTDTGTAATTTEPVATDRTTAETQAEVTGKIPVPTGSASETVFSDSTSFHARAASASIFEVLSGVQAKSRARHAEVKNFASQMVTAHTKTTDDLKRIAGMRNLTLPNSALGTHQRMINKLTNEEDADEFDEEYMDMQVTVHKQTVELFESAAKSQTDPELKAFADRNLPELRANLAEARRIKDLVN